jgi:hypothetical protein
MKESKDTRIEYLTQSGKNVIIIVHREYGSYVEQHHDSENGIDYDTNEFADKSEISVEVVGVCKFNTCYLPKVKHPKIDMYYLSGGRFTVAVPDDVAKQIWNAEKERLNDEFSPSVKTLINEAKKAIKKGMVLPASELNKRRKSYNDLQNEGGDGYNPYDYYMTAEHIEHIKNEYPEHF